MKCLGRNYPRREGWAQREETQHGCLERCDLVAAKVRFTLHADRGSPGIFRKSQALQGIQSRLAG